MPNPYYCMPMPFPQIYPSINYGGWNGYQLPENNIIGNIENQKEQQIFEEEAEEKQQRGKYSSVSYEPVSGEVQKNNIKIENNQKEILYKMVINDDNPNNVNILSVFKDSIKKKLIELKNKYPEIINFEFEIESENNENQNKFVSNTDVSETIVIKEKMFNLLENVFFCQSSLQIKSLKNDIMDFISNFRESSEFSKNFNNNFFRGIYLNYNLSDNLFKKQPIENRIKLICFLFCQNFDLNKILKFYKGKEIKEFKDEMQTLIPSVWMVNYRFIKTMLLIIINQIKIFKFYVNYKLGKLKEQLKSTEKIIFCIINEQKIRKKFIEFHDYENEDIIELVDSISLEDFQDYLFISNILNENRTPSFEVKLKKNDETFILKMTDFEKINLLGRKIKEEKDYINLLLECFDNDIKEVPEKYALEFNNLKGVANINKTISNRRIKSFIDLPYVKDKTQNYILNHFIYKKMKVDVETTIHDEFFDMSVFEDDFLEVLTDSHEGKYWNFHDYLNFISYVQTSFLK